MKTILVDAVYCFIIEKEDGFGIFTEMQKLLDGFSNRKIILTGANDEQFKKFGLDNMPYEVFTLKHNPEKTNPVYYEKIANLIYVMEKIPSHFDNEKTEDTLRVENTIRELLPTDELIKMFGKDTYLIGGAVRDVIFGKNPLDFDLMSRTSIDVIRKNLEDAGFTESKEGKFLERSYSIKKDIGVFNILLNGKEFQIASIGDKEVLELTSTADINLNCCAFALGSSEILDKDILKEILNKELRFMNPDLARSDPMKIVSALKQILRIPDLKIPDETMEIIHDSIPMVINFFTENSNRRHKLKPLFGNINSGQILNLFENFDTKDIFDGIDMKKSKLNVSDMYFSDTVEELTLDMKSKLSAFVASQFGKRFDSSKLFNSKINSVAYELDDKGDVISCCLIDGERLYATSAVNSEKIVKLVSDLCRNNYNVWSTISITSMHLINLCPYAGLNVVEDPALVEKILVNNYPKYKGQLTIETKRGHTVFSKKDSDDTPQVLAMS